MSTLRVYNIENPSTAAGGIGIATDGSVTVGGLQQPTAGPLSNRNLIINGAMAIMQRTSDSTAISDNSYLVQDRMHLWEATDGDANLESSTDVPAGEGFTKSLKWDVTSADTSIGADQYAAIDYRIEGLDHAQLCYGTAQAKTIAISFWAKSTLTGPFGYSIRNLGTSRSFIREFSFAAANTWERITLTIPGDTGGTWNTSTNVGAYHQISLSMGTSFQGTADSWTDSNNVATSNQVNLMGDTNNDFYLTGWQVEVGERSTPFEHRSYGDELARCQRYCYAVSSSSDTVYTRFGLGPAMSSTEVQAIIYFPVTMRNRPSDLSTSAAATFQASTGATGYDGTAISMQSSTRSLNSANVILTTSGMTANNPHYIEANDSSGAYLIFSAEI